MPELPDVTAYVEALERKVGGRKLEAIRLKSPFLLRSVDPPLSELEGRTLRETSRLGKRVVLGFGDELYLVLHLMIAGRLRWREKGAAIQGRIGLAAFDFENGTVLLSEAGTKKRASLYAVRGTQGLSEHDRGGIDPLGASLEEFGERLTARNHTVKRALCDPGIFSGIGNAYSDEILHRARLSPLKTTSKLSPKEVEELYRATRSTLEEWIELLRQEVGDGFPEKVTAFREGMTVHGRYKEPCPVCEAPVQRIVYASNETNYCAGCQTGGRLLADRALSRLLKEDWPRSLDEL